MRLFCHDFGPVSGCSKTHRSMERSLYLERFRASVWRRMAQRIEHGITSAGFPRRGLEGVDPCNGEYATTEYRWDIQASRTRSSRLRHTRVWVRANPTLAEAHQGCCRSTEDGRVRDGAWTADHDRHGDGAGGCMSVLFDVGFPCSGAE